MSQTHTMSGNGPVKVLFWESKHLTTLYRYTKGTFVYPKGT